MAPEPAGHGGLSGRVARFVTRYRVFSIGVILIACGALATQIPRLKVDSSPEQLLASFEGQQELTEQLRTSFGASDDVLVLLVRADDVADPASLSYVHRASRHFAAASYVQRVESITATPVARREPGASRSTTSATLEDLALEDLDGAEEPTEDVSPEVEDALSALVIAEPERYPLGLASLAPILDEIHVAPLVRADRTTVFPLSEEEAASVRRGLDEAPLLEGRLISRDRDVAAIVLYLASSQADSDDAVSRVEDWVAEHPPPPGVEVLQGGLPIIRSSIARGMERDQRVLLPLTLLVCGVVLFLAFRWIRGVLLPLAAVAITTVIVVGSMALAGEPMTILTQVVPVLLILIGVSDSIHLVNRYRQELRHAPDRIVAARRTVRAMTVACFMTSVTTSIGLASLLVSQTEMLRHFGFVGAVGVLVAYVVTIGLLPPALTFSRPPDPKTSNGGALERVVVSLTSRVLRRRWTVLGVSALVLVASFVIGARVTIDTALLDQFDPDDPALVATHVMDRELEGTRALEILLSSPTSQRFHEPRVLAALDETAAWLERQPGVLSVQSPSEPLHESWALLGDDPRLREASFVSRDQVAALATLLTQSPRNPLSAFLTEDGRHARMQVRLADVGARASAVIIEEATARLDRALGFAPDVRIGMTGEAYAGSLAVEAVVHDLLGSLLLAVAAIFGLLSLLFRSFRLGLLSIPPNIIPLVLTAAWMTVRGIPLNIATVIIFSMSLGLAVDGTIHVLARFREETDAGRSGRDALLTSARGTGRALVVSNGTLSLGFGVLLLSDLVPIRQFGELIAVTGINCLLATLIVLPALLDVAGTSGRRREAEASPAVEGSSVGREPIPTG